MWLKFLTFELASLETLIEPKQEMLPGDVIVGVASEDLQRLFTLWTSSERGFDELTLKIKYGEVESEKEADHIRELAWKKHMLSGIFWTCVKDEFKLWGVQGIGIRKGFNIVTSTIQPVNDIGRFFQQFFEGG